MIEWIEIDEFRPIVGQTFLFCYISRNTGERCITDRDHYQNLDIYTYNGCKVTHAAYLNMPVEKTLLEKFENRARGVDVNLLKDLVQILEEHYNTEGK